ncbi:MAG: HprK-related kinase A [Methylothermaceae bacterium]|nr:HprK-related kinase A [Methylothermaceae bacterium]
MKVADLGQPELAQCLLNPQGIVLKSGPFSVRIRSSVGCFSPFLHLMYANFSLLAGDALADFRIRLRRPDTIRYFFRPQVYFKHDGRRLFEPFPLNLAPPLFEWGLNWCIATRAHQYLMLHAAVLEREGRAVIMPALPGAGKSTLCAALMLNGWRLLSDEFGLLRADGALDPLPRPIPLKNQSIEVIRTFAPDAVLGPLFPKTRKGTVAHLQPTSVSVEKMRESATPAWIVFPRFRKDASASLKPVVPSYALLKLATNAFNYEVLGAEGFRRVGRLVRNCRLYNFTYGRLEDAMNVFDALPVP